VAAHTYPITINQGSEWAFSFTYSTKLKLEGLVLSNG